ncbi:conserved hypothetical protein [Gammaproteobacteria bacterium]
MKNIPFDLNDIEHEPSDEQLDALMEEVIIEARRRAEIAREKLMIRLREDIAHAQQLLAHM